MSDHEADKSNKRQRGERRNNSMGTWNPFSIPLQLRNGVPRTEPPMISDIDEPYFGWSWQEKQEWEREEQKRRKGIK